MTRLVDEPIIDQPARVLALRSVMGAISDTAAPLVELCRPYVVGAEQLPADGRFLLVANHTQGGMEVPLILHYIRQAIGTQVRPLAERAIGQTRGPLRDVAAALGAVVGSPDNAGELMRHDETILVFPGGGREIAKFKGEEHRLSWAGRAGFARVAIAHDYPIVPVGLVGSDDMYEGLLSRDSLLGRLSLAFTEKKTGHKDMPLPLMRGIGPTLIPRPRRMYLQFGAPITTTRPADVEADDWVDTVKQTTQGALEDILADLQAVRADDPYRSLNPLAWHRAVRAAG